MDKVYHSQLLNSGEYALLATARESIRINRWIYVKVNAKQLHDALKSLDLARLEVEDLKKKLSQAGEDNLKFLALLDLVREEITQIKQENTGLKDDLHDAGLEAKFNDKNP